MKPILPGTKEKLRYHPIDWNAKNIPIKREEIDWVSKEIIFNEEEFPFFQFHVSKALGRVVGYWQENIFHIVLLDTMHNLQPTLYNDYKVTDTHNAESDLMTLLRGVEQLQDLGCSDKGCIIKKEVAKVRFYRDNSNAIICFLEDDFLAEMNKLCEKHKISEILQAGILAMV